MRHSKTVHSATPQAKVSLLVVEYPEGSVRPKTRGDCENGERPCPWVSCRHHLYLSVSATGQLRIEHPGEPENMLHSCSLDIAAEGEHTLEEVGGYMHLTKERTRQLEELALMKMENPLLEWADHDP